MPVNVPTSGTVTVNDHVAPPSVVVPLMEWSVPLPKNVFPDIVKVPGLLILASPVFAWFFHALTV